MELPDYRLAYLYRFDAEGVARTLTGDVRYVVVFDRDQFTADALAVLSAGGRYVPLEERTFVRSRRVHTQHDQVRGKSSPISCARRHRYARWLHRRRRRTDRRYLAQDVPPGRQRQRALGREMLTSTLRLTLAPAAAYRYSSARSPILPDRRSRSTRQAANERLLDARWVSMRCRWRGAVSAGEITTLALIHAVAQSPSTRRAAARTPPADRDYRCRAAT